MVENFKDSHLSLIGIIKKFRSGTIELEQKTLVKILWL